MIEVGVKFLRSCMGHRASGRVRARSPPQQYKRSYSSIKGNDRRGYSSSSSSTENSSEMSFKGDEMMTMKTTQTQMNERGGNRVMVVVDSSIEAKGALQWALSHTLQKQDTLILLHVTKPGGKLDGEVNQKAYELLCSMKNTCQMKRPGVQVEVEVQEGKEKGTTIVEAAKKQRVSLLVLGQRKRSVMWRIRMIWSGKRSHNRAMDYCIQNANCMTIAVRRNSRKYGGYLITTKRHKKFWLLA